MSIYSPIEKSELDVIFIRDLKVDCILGVLPEERIRAQTVICDLELHLNVRDAAQSGSLLDTVDYSALAQGIADLLQRECFYLLESAAEAVATHCLKPPLRSVCISLSKPLALAGNGIPGVRIVRHRL